MGKRRDRPACRWAGTPRRRERTSIEFGTNWIRSGTSALLVVPIAVPEEFNALINPKRSDSARIAA
jgi:hypothetical protein